jgi:hypothetical protein
MTDYREWRVPALTSPEAIGERLLSLVMANPDQVFRVFRTGEDVIFVAVEGERWILEE